MISTIAHIGAVPFGYIREMNECEVHCHDELCPDAAGMAGYNLLNRTGLPDVIVSNTPPSSPNRPARRSTPQFPVKTSTKSYALVTPSFTSLSGTLGGASSSRAASWWRDNDLNRGFKYVRTTDDEETCPPSGMRLAQPLPQLLQEILKSQRCREEPRDMMVKERGRGIDQKDENGREQRWRRVGGNLRMIADLFEANSAKGVTKKARMPATLTIPASLTSCLSASILWLLYWRFFNKFR